MLIFSVLITIYYINISFCIAVLLLNHSGGHDAGKRWDSYHYSAHNAGNRIYIIIAAIM